MEYIFPTCSVMWASICSSVAVASVIGIKTCLRLSNSSLSPFRVSPATIILTKKVPLFLAGIGVEGTTDWNLRKKPQIVLGFCVGVPSMVVLNGVKCKN